MPTDNSTQLAVIPQDTNVDIVNNFVSIVFPELLDEENALFWSTESVSPGYPVSEQAFLKTVNRKPKASCYYGTATMHTPDTEGVLFNRQNLFHTLYVLVLDDVGTGIGSKCTADQIPDALKKLLTYRVETSPGNEQWGFSLKEPVSDLETAKELVRLFVGNTKADSGGCMPNKLVRLPCGVNLKEKYANESGELFKCRLLELNEVYATPDELLLASDAGVTFEDVVAGRRGVGSNLRSGATAFREVYNASLDGVVDPVLTWLNDRGAVVSETASYQTIICPWGKEHSEGGDITAGYKPVGKPGAPDRRIFHCFHEGCKSNKTQEFLDWVVQEGGPQAGALDPVAPLLAKYGMDMVSNEAINMMSGGYERIPMAGFKNAHMKALWVSTGRVDGYKKCNQYALWQQDDNLTVFTGVRREPGGERVIDCGEGGRKLNTWTLPEWGAGSYDQAQVDVFKDFIEYLMPVGDDAEYFFDHLASKAQNPQYRGAGIIMTTPVQGTGRGTMEGIIKRLWGAANTRTLSLGSLIKGLSGEGANDWIRGDWIIIPEAKEATNSKRFDGLAYESLKTFVEPGGVSLKINRKYVPEWYEDCYGSVIICSQHESVISMEAGDTRFRRIKNTLTPRDYDYFKGLRAWIEGGFEPHLWRWLLDRDLSHFNGFARQARTGISQIVSEALESSSPIDAAINLCLGFGEERCDGLINIPNMLVYLEQLTMELGLEGPRWSAVVKRELRNQTGALATTLWVHGKPTRMRHTVWERGIQARDDIELKEKSGYVDTMNKIAPQDLVTYYNDRNGL